jgi:hypothetical protein
VVVDSLVKLGDVTVPLRVVVVCVNHDLTRERCDGHFPVVPERHGNDHDVSGPGCIICGRCARARSELADECGKRLRSTRVADHHVEPVRHGKSRDLASDVSRADEANGLCHTESLQFFYHGEH